MMHDSKQATQSEIPSIWRRIKASFIDYLVILVWMAALGLVGLVLSLITGSYPDYLGTFGPVGTQMIFFSVLTLPIGIYLFVTESGPRHATLGKRKMRILVAKANGEDPAKKDILIRTIVKLLPWEIAHTFIWQMQYIFYQHGYEADIPVWVFVGLNIPTVLVIVYIATVAVRRDGRAPHDLAAGTCVVVD